MRVLTWNLWWRYGPWRERWKAIAEVLAQVAPDVCGLQEVWGTPQENLAADLAARLGMQWCWTELPLPYPHPEHGVISTGNAVLSRWPIVEQAELPLPTPDLRDEHRAALYTGIDTPGGRLPLFTTHLTYRPGGSAVRVAQVRTLAAFVAERGMSGDYPPAVTGDLNADPDADELRLLGGLLTAPAVPELVLLDAWRYADPNDPGFTWDRRNPYQAESVIPDSRLDYVLVGLRHEGRGRVRYVQLAGTEPVDGVWPSDHFAVVAELTD
jgi:endonuclease/exonuclease/phosphatase family metal-dependent hydrolase